jgi:hypothetical protein
MIWNERPLGVIVAMSDSSFLACQRVMFPLKGRACKNIPYASVLLLVSIEPLFVDKVSKTFSEWIQRMMKAWTTALEVNHDVN